jgi:hypothetical protein
VEGFQFSKLIVDPMFAKVLEDLARVGIKVDSPYNAVITFEDQKEGAGATESIRFLENNAKYKLNPSSPNSLAEGRKICAYDESLVRITSLEGSGFFIPHSIIMMDKDRYLPFVYLTFHFYTKSKRIADGNNSLSFSVDPPEVASKRQYIADRFMVLTENVPSFSLLLIDGPLVGGQITEKNLQLNETLLSKDIAALFIVKNSDSSLVVNNIPNFKDQYNSDFEWAYKTLGVGERTSFIKYTDLTDPAKRRNKVFCYLKAFNSSPIRLELHESTYLRYFGIINNILDTVYFLLLAQGDATNPQPRPVAIAEKYAREILKMISFDQVVYKAGIIPTMNYTRFGW